MGSDFSYGEQRLICLARLFMGNHTLFLLDEPTAGVNPNYFKTIKLIMQKMIDQHNSTILLIEHNMHFVREIADYCAFINEGAIQYFGSPEEVLNNQQVRNSYLGI